MKKTFVYLLPLLTLAAVIGLGVCLLQGPSSVGGVGSIPRANAVVGETYIQLPDRVVLLGDFDRDKSITSTDARCVLQVSVGKYGIEGDIGVEGLLDYQFAAADVNRDGEVTTTDARLILQAAVGKISEFPDPVEPEPTTLPTYEPAPRKVSSRSNEPVEDLTAATVAVINEDPDTFCNPINISYGYRSENGVGYREGADPVIQAYRGEYYLFVSHTYGYWWSPDLHDWTFVACMEAEMDKWAPASCVVGDTLYLTHSQGGSIFKSTDPKAGTWEPVGKPLTWEDPALFYDEEDGYVYCYYGCSPVDPMYVAQLDPANNMALVNGPFECFYQNRAAHGFENLGDNNVNISPDDSANCYVEGAWVIKHNGKYYYNYAVPGTDKNYANGCYVADSPLGPFTFCESSPFTKKYTGFVQGVGHGAVFQDLWGNWWAIETSSINRAALWERRIELLPVAFDKNDNIIADNALLDYPMYVPALVEDNFRGGKPGWNLLSYNAAAASSSVLNADTAPGKAADENISTWWSAASGNVGEWLMLDLGTLCEVDAVQINFADQDAQGVTGRNNTFVYRYLMEFSQDGETWYKLADHSRASAQPYEARDTSHDYYELVSPIGARYIRVTNKGAVPASGKFAISGLRVFGSARGEAPAKAEGVTVDRPESDERTVTVSWNPVEGADGYVIRFGYQEDVLNQVHHAYGVNTVTLHSLNMGVDYWFTVDAFNASGYTEGGAPAAAPHTKPAPEGRPVKPPVIRQYILPDLPVYEAENGTWLKGVTRSSAPEDARASGKTSLHNMHIDGAYFEVSGVDGGAGGSAALHLGYACANHDVTVEVILNGVSLGDFDLEYSMDWSQFTSVDIPLTGLKAGTDNVIRIVCGNNGGYNPDFFQIVFGG